MREEAERLRALEPAGFAAAVHEAIGGVLGDIELTTPIASFPIQLQYALEYVRPRLRAHRRRRACRASLAGQGLNLAFWIAPLWPRRWARRAPPAPGRFCAAAPIRAQAQERNLIAAAAFDGLERLFSSSNPGVERLRAAGLGAVGSLSFVKRRLAKRALGIGGDVPAFVREQIP